MDSVLRRGVFCRVMAQGYQGPNIAVWRVKKRKNKNLCVMKACGEEKVRWIAMGEDGAYGSESVE